MVKFRLLQQRWARQANSLFKWLEYLINKAKFVRRRRSLGFHSSPVMVDFLLLLVLQLTRLATGLARDFGFD